MQDLNWADLRFLLALERGGTLAGAARLLDVDETTVSRRLGALQKALGADLVQRRADGVVELSPAGRQAARHAEGIESRVHALADSLGHAGADVAGVVRLTAVPYLVNRVLAPAIGGLLEAHPSLGVELIPESRDLSLTRREADLALRMARPRTGGRRVTARRVGRLAHGVYAARSHRRADALPWVRYDDALGHTPHARWLADRAVGAPGGLRVHDVETALEAVAAGYGRTLLPHRIAEGDRRLRGHRVDEAPAPPARDVWLLTHADQRHLARIRAVADWAVALVADHAPD